MRASLDIFTNPHFTKESYIGTIKLDSIPTTSMPYSFDENNKYYLNNLVNVDAIKAPSYNGLYFVAQSVLYAEENMYSNIELILEKYNELNSPFLYLKGTMTYVRNTENFIKIKLTGEIEKEIDYIILPRTSLDYISYNGYYYECDKVIHNSDGRVEIQTINKKTLEQFRNTTTL